MTDLKALVRSFYTECLTVNERVNPVEVMNTLFSDDFQSINAKETKSKAALIGQIQFFWKLVPDLKWDPLEILQDGNKVIVRSEFSGSPKGDFMGMPTDGTKKFKTMSIDIHTIENGRIKKVYHVEEWPTAIAQLKP